MPEAVASKPKNFDINYKEPLADQSTSTESTKVHTETLGVPPRDHSPARSEISTASVIVDHKFVQPPKGYDAKFPWRRVAAYIDPEHPPALEELQKMTTANNGDKLTKYISEKYYADLYWNCSLVVAMCTFSWLLAYMGIGLLSVFVVTIGGFVVYRAEFRRFNTNIRDDMQRVNSADQLEKRLESMHWLNNFLSKFWVIYMPALSDMVISSTNAVLKEVSPPPPIDKLTLDQFTLGTKAPKVESIKSFTKLGADIYQMDWNFNFTPNDKSDMTANELKSKIAPKVALGIRVGKGFVGASLPILVEDMSFSGLMRIKLKIGDTFPHIDVVSICFLEQPKIDYALKPVGGNTFGIDIMSLIPGLSSFVNGLIHSNLAPMLYAPNSLDINVHDIVDSSLPSAMGVLAVKIRGAEYNAAKENAIINPYVEYGVENAPLADIHETDIKSNTCTPVFNDTKYILINSLQTKMKFKLMSLKKTGDHDELAEASFELQDLLQDPEQTMIETKLTENNRNVGKLVYDLIWYPVLESPEGQETKEVTKQPESDTGIFEFTLLAARNLDSSKSLLGKPSTFAELYIDEELAVTSRLAKGTSNPEYKCKLERLINSKATSHIKILIKDISSYGETILAEYKSTNLADLIFISTQKSHKLNFTTGQGQLKFSAVWKPLPSISQKDDVTFVPPIGILRLHVINAKNLPNLEKLGTIDPYLQVLSGGVLKGESDVVKSTLNPNFNDVFYLSIQSRNEKINLRVMDVESGDQDREVGSLNVDLSNFLKDPANQNKKFRFEGRLSRNNESTGEIFYVLSYYPLFPVYSRRELQAIYAKQNESQNDEDDLEDLEEQAKYLEDYKKNPDNYEWIDNDTVEQQLMDSKKTIMSLDDVLNYKSGVLGINLLKGSVKEKAAYVEVLIDDRNYPDFISRQSTNGRFHAHSGDAFIRDLPNSIVTFRITKSEKVNRPDQVIAMTSEPYKVIDLLKNGYDQVMKVNINGSLIDFMFEYAPSTISMGDSDSVSDTGMLTLKLLKGVDLPPADSNGYSDPFVIISLNGKESYRSKTIKKTLNPEWNETTKLVIKSRERDNFVINVFDWDMAGKNDFLGVVTLNLNEISVNETQKWKLPLEKASGYVEFETKFVPGYIRPGLGVITNAGNVLNGKISDFGALGATVAGGAVNLAGGAAGNALNAAGGAAGGALNVAGGVTGGAAGLLRKLGHGSNHKAQARTSTSSFRPLQPKYEHSKTPSTGGMSTRSSMDVASVMTETFHGSSSLPGRLTIGHMNIKNNDSAHYQLKVTLVSQSLKMKTLCKTKPLKIQDGDIKWNEQVAFKCDPHAVLAFEVRQHHVLGKDKVVGEAQVNLSDVVGKKDDIIVNTEVGSITLNFNYGA